MTLGPLPPIERYQPKSGDAVVYDGFIFTVDEVQNGEVTLTNHAKDFMTVAANLISLL